MYHKTNFGLFGGRISQYADLRGYVPELGDDPEDMEWDGDWTEDNWIEHVEAAEAATADAEFAIAEWRVA